VYLRVLQNRLHAALTASINMLSDIPAGIEVSMFEDGALYYFLAGEIHRERNDLDAAKRELNTAWTSQTTCRLEQACY
jgi:hypothetical protein